jgi:hypothetical protein
MQVALEDITGTIDVGALKAATAERVRAAG